MKYSDAHCHFTLCAEKSVLNANCETLSGGGELSSACVSACFENEWSALAELPNSAFCGAEIFRSYGVHPASIAAKYPAWRESKLLELRKYLQGASAVGEAGLDERFFPDFGRAEQAEFFAAQVDLAREYGLPVIVHCVGAWGSLFDTLSENFSSKGAVKFMLHGASCSPEMAERFVDLNAYFSFGEKSLKYPKTAACARAVPVSRILIESDFPRVINAGAEVSQLARAVSELSKILNLGAEKIVEASNANFKNLFQKI